MTAQLRQWCGAPCVLPFRHTPPCWDGTYPADPDPVPPLGCECEPWMIREGSVMADCPVHDPDVQSDG